MDKLKETYNEFHRLKDVDVEQDLLLFPLYATKPMDDDIKRFTELQKAQKEEESVGALRKRDPERSARIRELFKTLFSYEY